MAELNNKCPYCGADARSLDYRKGNGGDETATENESILFYTCICERCGRKSVSAYRWLGILSLEEFRERFNLETD